MNDLFDTDPDGWVWDNHTGEYRRPVPSVLVWVVDPVTGRRHTELKNATDVKPTDERVRF